MTNAELTAKVQAMVEDMLSAGDRMQENAAECEVCDGSGWDADDPCLDCEGSGCA